jgi:DNA processing protein
MSNASESSWDPALVEAVRLSLIEGVGPRIRQDLLERFGTAEAIFDASPDQVRDVRGVGPKLLSRLTLARSQTDPIRELQLCKDAGVKLILQSDPNYPRLLSELPDPPYILYCRGEIVSQDGVAVAMVGTRHPTRYGVQTAKKLAGALARIGVTIVSGLARGIDAAAHQGALEAGGRTIAVLGSGVLNLYPPEHDQLAKEVIDNGLLLSEMPPEFPPIPGAFPQRNRIISGLSLGTIVVEAARRSGALITARLATEQNRELFAVPGRIDCPMAAGPNRLIRDGAKLVESIDDILEELGPLVQGVTATQDKQTTIRNPAELSLNEIEQAVLSLVATEPTPIDRVIAESKMPAPRVLSTINVLARKRLIERLSGATIIRK